ncbi:MAG: hypothetical protein QOI41_1009 [Myxococcales bacterium]|nr:hypothetical protein [Myxococcales bacterium]
MPLAAPKFAGPLTDFSTKVRVQNALPGATITIYQNGIALIPSFTAAGTGNEVFDFGRRAFTASASVTIDQTVNGEPSVRPPDLTVFPVPSALPARLAPTQRVVCATCILTDNVMPGTTVKVEGRINGGAWTPRGAAVALDTSTAVTLSTPVLLDEEFRVQAVAPVGGYSSPWTAYPEKAVPSSKLADLKPRMIPDVYACQTQVQVENCVVGATLTTVVNGADIASFTAQSASYTIGYTPALTANQKLAVRQGFGKCDTKEATSETLTVLNGPLPVPHLFGPLCAGETVIKLGGLFPGARIQIWVKPPGGTATLWAEAIASNSVDDFYVSPIGPSADVYALQGLCAPVNWSNPSNTVRTASSSTALPVPVVDPAYDCQTFVRVSNLEPGTTVRVRSKNFGNGGEIGRVDAASGSRVDIPLAAPLVADDDIEVLVSGCGQGGNSVIVTVKASDPPNPPEFAESPETLLAAVKLKKLIVGATVQVWVDGIRLGTLQATETTATVPLTRALNADDKEVVALQWMCDPTVTASTSSTIKPFAPWRVIVADAGILAVHAALLPSGKVLYFGGDQHNWRPPPNKRFDATRLFDPETRQITVLGSPAYDVFCCGHAFLTDGRLLIVGGSSKTPDETPNAGWEGIQSCSIFDWQSNTWQPAANLMKARWYPSALTLHDGRVLAAGGYDGTCEVYDASNNTWTLLPNFLTDLTYPRVALYKDDRVFCVTRAPGGSTCLALDAATGTVSPMPPTSNDITDLKNAEYMAKFNYSLIPLPITPSAPFMELLVVGLQSTKKPLTIIPSASTPSWVATADRALPAKGRLDCCATLLADGTLLLSGGNEDDTDGTATQTSEIFDPVLRSWTASDTANVRRRYHSETLLLPDASLLSLGSNKNPRGHNDNPGVPGAGVERGANDANEYQIEAFRPSYLTRGVRPMVNFVTAPVPRGVPFHVGTSDAATISTVRLTRLGSYTHSGDTDQRCVELAILARTPSSLLVSPFPSGDLAPPGYYLVFLENLSGSISEGRITQVLP